MTASGSRVACVYDAVYPFSKGGAERRIHEYAGLLQDEGFVVTVFCRQGWPGQRSEVVVDGVRVRALCRRRSLYTRSGRRSIRQAVGFGLSCTKLLWHRFDVLDCCEIPFFSLIVCKFVATIKRKPLMSTWHEVWGRAYWRAYLGPVGGEIGAWVERVAVRLPDRIVCVSGATAARLRSELGYTGEVHVLPNGVDLVAAAAAEPSDARSEIVFVGRLIRHKRVDLLLEAVALLARSRPDVRCVVVGTGPEAEALTQVATRLGLATNVRFLGEVTRQADVLSLVKSSRVLVLPSEREGFGMVALEANACGVPVMTVEAPLNATTQLIRQGENGWVVAPTPGALAEALDDALTLEHDSDTCLAAAHCWSWREVAVRYDMSGAYSWPKASTAC